MRRLSAALGRWRPGAFVLAILLSGLATQPAAAEQPLQVDVLSKGSSSLLGIRKAKAGVPVRGMHPTSQARVQSILKNLSIYRRLPEIRCQADPRVLDYFLDNPDVAVEIWRTLGVSNVRMTRLGPGQYTADDGQGSRGNLTVVYRDAGQQVIVCSGQFVNPVSKKPIDAEAVIHFRHRSERSRDGQAFVRQDATMFVALPSNTVEAVARAISPVSNRLADKNFEEVSLFVRMMSVAMSEQPDWIQSLADRMTEVPTASRDEMMHLASTLHGEATGRPMPAGRGPRVRMVGAGGGVTR